MEYWICITCGTQYPASLTPPQGCPICLDQRQYVRHEGQAWTTMAAMQQDGFRNTLRPLESGLILKRLLCGKIKRNSTWKE